MADLTAMNTIESILRHTILRVRPDSYDNNIIPTETYNTPVPDLKAMITIESILRRTIVQCQT